MPFKLFKRKKPKNPNFEKKTIFDTHNQKKITRKLPKEERIEKRLEGIRTLNLKFIKQPNRQKGTTCLLDPKTFTIELRSFKRSTTEKTYMLQKVKELNEVAKERKWLIKFEFDETNWIITFSELNKTIERLSK